MNILNQKYSFKQLFTATIKMGSGSNPDIRYENGGGVEKEYILVPFRNVVDKSGMRYNHIEKTGHNIELKTDLDTAIKKAEELIERQKDRYSPRYLRQVLPKIQSGELKPGDTVTAKHIPKFVQIEIFIKDEFEKGAIRPSAKVSIRDGVEKYRY